jgi:hypothetical protein
MALGLDGLEVTALADSGFGLLRPLSGVAQPLKGRRLRRLALEPDLYPVAGLVLGSVRFSMFATA